MSHLTTSTPAIALGTCIGLAAGLYGPRAARRSAGRSGPGGARPAAPAAFDWLVPILGAGFGALVGARFGVSARLPAYLYLAALAPVLGAADAATKRLPNRVLLPAYPIVMVLLAFAAWRAGETSALWRAVAAGTALYGLFLVVALVVAPGSLGFGDVKLAGLLGLFIGFLGWATVWIALMIAFGSAALYVVLRALLRRGPRIQTLPLGPVLLLGSLVAAIVA
ncbi:prepilin peptidase [Catenulispora rubra]|uniref:prepilin peptidase n=1 Tax=Catenulispora rubra TaxID=280293 RepID=UPI00189250A1|nr:A24 family peptidase [Catenulispora rubra]